MLELTAKARNTNFSSDRMREEQNRKVFGSLK